MSTMIEGRILNVREAAESIGCTTGRVCQLLASGEIAGVKLNGRAWAVDFESLQKFLKKPQGVGRPRISR